MCSGVVVPRGCFSSQDHCPRGGASTRRSLPKAGLLGLAPPVERRRDVGRRRPAFRCAGHVPLRGPSVLSPSPESVSVACRGRRQRAGRARPSPVPSRFASSSAASPAPPPRAGQASVVRQRPRRKARRGAELRARWHHPPCAAGGGDESLLSEVGRRPLRPVPQSSATSLIKLTTLPCPSLNEEIQISRPFIRAMTCGSSRLFAPADLIFPWTPLMSLTS